MSGWWWFLIIVLVLAIIGGVVFFVMKKKEGEASAGYKADSSISKKGGREASDSEVDNSL
jgi:F0F1-type ATP synthase assembly protein I